MTSLVGGERVAKNSIRVECYGTVDELNGWLALCQCDVEGVESPVDFWPFFNFLQQKMFDIGSYLATNPGGKYVQYTANPVSEADVCKLEKAIDAIEAELPPFRFVLPGGSAQGARAHIARTICRRAERHIVTLSEHSAVDPQIMAFVNRLSDFLFALARFDNIRSEKGEIFWSKDC